MELQVVLNNYATTVFRRQADFDYVAARSNYRLQLRQQFLWSAQQTVEKYLKAILLFNGMSARYPVIGKKKEFGHDLLALVDGVKTIEIFQFALEPEEERFVRYLADQGPNRYMGRTAYNTGQVLYQLDSAVWHIRRYCQYMPDRGIGCTEPVPGLREASVRAALSPRHKDQPHRFSVFGGELEKIIQRPPSDPARRALVWANLYYGSRRRTMVAHRAFSSSELPPHERNWQGVDWIVVEQYVKL